MSICETCQKEHDGTYGSGRFCSQVCSRKYSSIINKEQKNRNLSIALKKSAANNPDYGFKNPNRRKAAILVGTKSRKSKYIEKIHDPNIRKYISTDAQRKLVISEQNGCCNVCGNSEWLGNPITLELEHKDGNTTNNVRQNLEALCPNCHSYTKTWRGRNKNKEHTIVSDETLLVALKEQPSIRKALISVGLAGKGGNYKRCYQLLANQV